MILRIYLALLLAITTSVALGRGNAVIAERYSGIPMKMKEEVTLLPGQVVTVRSTRSDLALVEDVDSPWTTEGGVWVPGRVLANKRSFKPMDKWDGERHVDVVAGDYAADYYFKSNGTFTYRSYDERNRPLLARGYLYRSKNIIWATKNVKTHINKEDIFVLMPNGKLCWPVPTDDCSPIP